MKISVITVCYNAEKTIGETIASVLAQKDAEIEYIVVDGLSKDSTIDVVRRIQVEWSGLSESSVVDFKVVSERDQGLYDALNKGIGMSTGDVVGLLNADDRFEDDFVLRDVSAAFGEAIDCIYGDIRFVRGDGFETVRYYSSQGWKRWMHNWGFMPAHPSVYVRRKVFDDYGMYKLGYEISADFEWMVRVICRGGIKAKCLPRCMVTMRLGGKSTAGISAMLKLNRENVRANRENGYWCCMAMMVPKYFYKIWGYVFRRR